MQEPDSREHLSALMDGELGTEPARFLLRRMEREPELARDWSRWHLIRACLAERAPSSPHADPLRLAATSDDDAFAARVLAAVHAQPQSRRHWARYLGGGAIAASVAAAALILAVPQTVSTNGGIAAGSDRASLAPTQQAAISRDASSRIAAVSANPDVSVPWLDRQPAFLAARPAAVSPILSSGYLRQAAYAPGAASAPMLVRDPQQQALGDAPYLIMLVPEPDARPQTAPQQH